MHGVVRINSFVLQCNMKKVLQTCSICDNVIEKKNLEEKTLTFPLIKSAFDITHCTFVKK